MPQTNGMYTEVTAKTNLRNLANLQDINSITEQTNGILASVTDAKKRERYVEYFYDKLLADTLVLGSENNVFVKYCETKTVPQGNAKYFLRRWGGLTEHTYPLAEGIPPKSDRMASESFEGTFCSYGRYMEFTDRVDFMLIDPVIAHYTMELADTAVRLEERLCREELVNNAGENYPDGKTFSQLVIGDTFGIADYRLHALKFKRILVKPLVGSKYVVICSPEHIYDLVSDPLVEKYMEYTNSADPYVSGKPVGLFDLQFEETMLDDYSYGYTEMTNPGEYEEMIGSTPTKMIRLVFEDPTNDKVKYYGNFASGTATSVENTAIAYASNTNYFPVDLVKIKREEKETYLKDGSYIPNIVKWDIEGFINELDSNTTLALEKYTLGTDSKGNPVWNSASTEVVNATKLATMIITQLPVHRSFMFGKEFIYKTGHEGRMGSKMYVKPLGSAGTLDPINQRQSIGWKIDTLGFNTVRAEAMQQFIFVPMYALDTYKAVKDSWGGRYPSGKLETAAKVNVTGNGTSGVIDEVKAYTDKEKIYNYENFEEQ